MLAIYNILTELLETEKSLQSTLKRALAHGIQLLKDNIDEKKGTVTKINLAMIESTCQKLVEISFFLPFDSTISTFTTIGSALTYINDLHTLLCPQVISSTTPSQSNLGLLKFFNAAILGKFIELMIGTSAYKTINDKSNNLDKETKKLLDTNKSSLSDYFQDLCILPMQRVLKYVLMFRDLLNEAIKLQLSVEALNKIKDIHTELDILNDALQNYVKQTLVLKTFNYKDECKKFTRIHGNCYQQKMSSRPSSYDRNSGQFTSKTHQDPLAKTVAGIIRILDVYLSTPLGQKQLELLIFKRLPLTEDKLKVEHFRNTILSIYHNKQNLPGALGLIKSEVNSFIRTLNTLPIFFIKAFKFLFRYHDGGSNFNNTIELNKQFHLLISAGEREEESKLYISRHIIQQAIAIFMTAEHEQSKTYLYKYSQQEQKIIDLITTELDYFFRCDFKQLQDILLKRFNDTDDKYIIALLIQTVKKHLYNGGIKVELTPACQATQKRFCAFFDKIKRIALKNPDSYIDTATLLDEAEPINNNILTIEPSEESKSQNADKLQNIGDKRLSMKEEEEEALDIEQTDSSGCGDSESNISDETARAGQKINNDKMYAEKDKQALLTALISFLKRYYQYSNEVDLAHLIPWNETSNQIAKSIERIYLEPAESASATFEKYSFFIIRSFKRSKNNNEKNLGAEFPKFQDMRLPTAASDTTVIESAGNYDNRHHILTYNLIRIYHYYNNTIESEDYPQKNQKNKWHKELSKLMQEVLLIYNSDYPCFAAQRILSLIDGTAKKIDKETYNSSRLANTLMHLSLSQGGNCIAPEKGADQLPDFIIQFNIDNFEQQTRAFKIAQKDNSLLLSNILAVTNYYLNNHIGRIDDQKKGVAFNTQKVKWRAYAEKLRQFTLDSNANHSQLTRNNILELLDKTVEDIRFDSYFFGTGSRLAETLAYISTQYGGYSLVKNKSLVLNDVLFDSTPPQALLKDHNPESIPSDTITGSLTLAKEYIASHDYYHSKVEHTSEVLLLIANLLRISAYYCNTPLAASINEQFKKDGITPFSPNLKKTKWRAQAWQMAIYALRTYDTQPALAKEYLISKIDDIAAEIRSHKLTGGNNSRLANTLENLSLNAKGTNKNPTADELKQNKFLPMQLKLGEAYTSDAQSKNLIYRFATQECINIIDDYLAQINRSTYAVKVDKAWSLRNELNRAYNSETLHLLVEKAGGLSNFLINCIHEKISIGGGVNPICAEGEFSAMISRLNNFVNSIGTADGKKPAFKALFPVYRV